MEMPRFEKRRTIAIIFWAQGHFLFLSSKLRGT